MKPTFIVRRFDDLEHDELRVLYSLTNISSHEKEDSGGYAGSTFQAHLDARMSGEDYPDTWVVLATLPISHVIGWCMVTCRRGDYRASMGFYVKPDHRRQGTGSRLIHEAQEVARKFGAHTLQVNPWNAASRAFFKSNGFANVSSWEATRPVPEEREEIFP